MLFFRIFRVFRGKKRGIPRTLKAIWYYIWHKSVSGNFLDIFLSVPYVKIYFNKT